ncbi:MATE family efflux transporter [Niameybacter massiliensis]|uniref:MATE family efflux transporter n=1 Tax=Niameybacter massiliensis TaxID=1658108 RepID=UPI0006B60EA2|nr:MATE family efflux transporter [Niameybacter massiliensis]
MKDNVYENKTLNQLILLFGIPSILALVIEMLTGITDTAFAGNLPRIGESALSAMALISPLLSVFTALQTLFAMSSGVLIAKYFNDEENRKSSMIVGLLMSILVSSIASLLCGIGLTSILQIIGAEGEILQLATVYMKIQLVSNIISSVGYTMTCTIRALGFPKAEMVIITVAVVVNIFFNALLSFGFHMGIQGLAWGTFISELICVILSILFLQKKSMLQITQKINLVRVCALGKEMFKIGFAQTVIQMLGGCTGFFVNGQLLHTGTTLSVAAWSIAQRIYMILLMPIVGLSQGVQTIIAYFSGEGEKEKVKRISSMTQKYCAIYGVIALVIVVLWGEQLLYVFGGNSEILALSQTILLIIFSGFPLVGIFYINITLLQVTGKEIASVLLALTRQVFLVIPLLFLLPTIFSNFGLLPIIGLFIATPIADCAVVVLSIILKKRCAYEQK